MTHSAHVSALRDALDYVRGYFSIAGRDDVPYDSIHWELEATLLNALNGTTNMIPISHAAKARGISARRLQALCRARRIPGARLIGRIWFLPESYVVTPGARGPKLR